MHCAASSTSGRERVSSGRARSHDAGGIHLSQKEIEVLRTEIERIDAQILGLVSKRERLASEIGLVKERDDLPIRDRPREKQVTAWFIRSARGMGINPVFAEILSELLISDAVRVQKTKKEKDLAGKTALVVGGAGRMGTWFCRTLRNRGAIVKAWDPRGKLDGYENVKSLRSVAKSSDIVVIASPLGACPEELKAVLGARPRGLVFDICSVKSHIAGLLRKGARDGIIIASVHPMFGPGAPSANGENVLLCDCGSKKGTNLAKNLFVSAGANVVQVDLEKHDELMAYVLSLSHLSLLLFAGTLRESGESVQSFRRVQGPSFGSMLKMSENLAKESVRVYHDIQALNPHNRGMITTMEKMLRELKKASLDKNHDKFKKAMESARDYLEVG